MASKLTYEETVQKYGEITKKKIGGWIAMIVIGVFLFFAGIALMVLGIVEEIIALIIVGALLYGLICWPFIAIGITFTVMNSVRRGIAKNKIKKAENAK